MKPIKTTLAFLAVIITLGSCATAQLRNIHIKELRAELDNYSDILDTASSKIYLEGGDYNFWNSSKTQIFMSLHLMPNNNNRETITVLRDGLIDYYEKNCYWEESTKKWGSYPRDITIEFVMEENGEAKILYRVYRYRHPIFPGYEWFEQWPNILSDGGYENLRYDHRGTGTPIMRKIMHNDELDILLGRYSDKIDIEQSGGYHSGTHFIGINIHYGGDYTSINDFGRSIANDLVVFFDNNHEKLVREYGRLNMMKIDWYYNGILIGTDRFEYNEREGRWGRQT